MIGTDLVVAGPVLALAVVVGLIAHELTHALVLRLGRIEYTLTYVPDRTDAGIGLLASAPWAVVRPHLTGREPAIYLRAAALAPVLLAVPVFAVGLTGGVPVDSPAATAFAVGWLACAIPSPQDFSVVFYAHRGLEREATTEPNAAVSRAD